MNPLLLLAPELIIFLAGLVIFLLDLVYRDAARTHLFQGIALVGLVLALVASLALLGQDATALTMMTVDGFAVFFKVLVIIVMILVVTAAGDYMQSRSRHQGEFYTMLLAATLAMTVAVSANNLVLIYLGMEFLSITSYVLAGFIRDDKRSSEAAIKYFLYGAVASGVMLYGLSLLYGATGSIYLTEIAAAFKNTKGLTASLGLPASILVITGFGFKASLAPFHQWAPDTYDGAPTPVTAFLSTASKATGFALLLRVLLVALPAVQTQWTAILAGIAMATMTLGNLAALRQTNVKRLLAYSSIAQAGYILIGLVAATSEPGKAFNGINGVLIYLFAYLFTNIGAFITVTAVEDATGSVELKDWSGLITRQPFLAIMMLIFMLSLAGIPPTGGFIGKFFVFGAAIQTQAFALAAVALVNAAIAAFYYLSVVRYMFFEPQGERTPFKISRPVQAVVAIAMIMTLVIGIFPGPFITWATEAVLPMLASL
ncbi:MAG: NADH-quinone oxidoreductase subunit N [Anaerolineae bacterium]|uniref:NADH-quinone oxidoreductase subunit N n=1 Tax=Candidatus Amarolinea dominans TaxID=3140696 RepID=UPI001D5E3CA3|nr:NADH-quinone oxidoreductase subunit N [Anaerolineae bacterium]MBK9095223.1 NADH-quinone oxidoreductase subunit N [Anaerolineae bacterium]